MINNCSGWVIATNWTPPNVFTADFRRDNGIRLVDLNGDGLVDMLEDYQNATSVKSAWINNGNGWSNSSYWLSPEPFTVGGTNIGRRIGDANGDGLTDILKGADATKSAWLNNGSGWISSNVWIPPEVFTDGSGKDKGLRLFDLNGDGLVDILQDYRNSSTTEQGAFINNGSGWTRNDFWIAPVPFTQDGKNVGRRITDVDGDGFGDIMISHDDGSVQTKKTIILLKNNISILEILPDKKNKTHFNISHPSHQLPQALCKAR